MADGRRNNGNKGHSTKPKSLKDRRLNPFKNVLKEAATEEDIKKVVKAMVKKALDGDTKAATLILNYYLGKPKESIDINATGNIGFSLKKLLTFDADSVEDAEEIKD